LCFNQNLQVTQAERSDDEIKQKLCTKIAKNKHRTNCIIGPPQSLEAMNCDRTKFEKLQLAKAHNRTE